MARIFGFGGAKQSAPNTEAQGASQKNLPQLLDAGEQQGPNFGKIVKECINEVRREAKKRRRIS